MEIANDSRIERNFPIPDVSVPRITKGSCTGLLFAFVIFAKLAWPASEIPPEIIGAFAYKQPSCFASSNEEGDECMGFVFNTVEIKKRTPQTAYVGITLRAHNGHGCGFYGIGRWIGGALIAKSRNGISPGVCEVAIYFEEDFLMYTISGDCDPPGICSARGSLSEDNVIFWRRN